MDDMEASCIFYVYVGTLDQLESSKIRIWTVTTAGVVMLTIQLDLGFDICFMQDRQDFLIQTLPDVLSIE